MGGSGRPPSPPRPHARAVGKAPSRSSGYHAPKALSERAAGKATGVLERLPGIGRARA